MRPVYLVHLFLLVLAGTLAASFKEPARTHIHVFFAA